ncbi:MAG: VOC family protein [Pseudomonadota bacterium]
MKVQSLDHLVLTVNHLQDTIDFYTCILGMKLVEFGDNNHNRRFSLQFGSQKINIHQRGQEFKPNARAAIPGSADICFLSDSAISDWQQLFERHDIPVEQGPVRRTGAVGDLISLYVRDPDGNLLEISNLLVPDSDQDTATYR